MVTGLFDFICQPSKLSVGGVGLLIANSLRYSVKDDLNSSSHLQESLWIEVHVLNGTKKNIVCGIVYRHPNTSLKSLLYHLSKSLDKVHKESKLCIIMGDFNINLLNCNSHALIGEFINLLPSYFSQPHILQPTHITSHSATLIDNIFFNVLECSTYSVNILYSLTDHLPNCLSIDSIHPFPLNSRW